MPQAQEACMTNMGQCCVAGTRTYVHENIYDEFVAKTKELALKRKIGDPFDSTTINGPQVKGHVLSTVVELLSGRVGGPFLQ